MPLLPTGNAEDTICTVNIFHRYVIKCVKKIQTEHFTAVVTFSAFNAHRLPIFVCKIQKCQSN